VNLSYSDNLITYLVEIGFSPLYGARPLKNTIKTYLTPVLADQLIDGKIKPHDTIILDVNEQKEIIVQHQL
jgi:ATP-dependent Clp protease ATP-binding subunit ClpB